MEDNKNLAEDNFLQHETEKRYLGDGVYASFDGYHVKLSTLEGNVIFLEPSVMDATVEYVSYIKRLMYGV